MIRLKIDDFSPAAIADSGQCFRMYAVNAGKAASVGFADSWELIAGKRYLRITELDRNLYQLSCTEQEWEEYFRSYFDLDTDYGIYRSCVLPDDNFLQECIVHGEGIRILQQDSFEMLISFIISQRKSVPAIRTSVDRICRLAGKPFKNEFGDFYAFPEPERLAECTAEELAGCGLGYRVEYVLQAARAVANGELDLKDMQKLSDEALLKYLMELRGVGLKVASCVALFGFHRLGICPQDVWMNRVLMQKYRGQWPEAYAASLGVLQQYMFYYARQKKLL